MRIEPSMPGARAITNARWGYMLQETAVFLGLTLMVLLSGSTARFVDLNLLMASAVLLSIAALLWLAFGQRGPTLMARPLLAWVILYLVSIPFSIDPRRSASQMLLMSVSIFLFLLAADLAARGWPAELLIKGILLAGAFVVCFSLIDAINWYRAYIQAGAPAGVIYRPDSANVAALFMNLLIMLALARLFGTRQIVGKVILSILILACAWTLYLTSSRAGWLATVAGLGCMGILYWRAGKLQLSARWSWLKERKLWLAGLALSIVLVALAGSWLLYRQATHPTHSASLSMARTEYWAPAWQAFLQHPILGQGAFTYANAYLADTSVPPRYLYIHGHGTWINLLSERGVLGALAMAWLLIAIGMALWRKLHSADQQSLPVLLGASASAAAFVVHSLFDGFFTEPSGLWLLVIALGAALGTPVLVDQKTSWWKRPWWVVILLGGLWLEIWTIVPLFKGVELANQNQWEGAEKSFETATLRDPYSVIASQQLGLAASSMFSERYVDSPGIPYLEKAISLDPNWAINYLNVGAFYASHTDDSDRQKGLEAFKKSVQAAPDCAVCYLNLGKVAEDLNQIAVAQDAYNKALSLNPEWVDAYFWRSTPLRTESRSAWIKQHPPAPPPTLVQLENDIAQKFAYALPYANLAEGYIDLGRLPEAERLLKIADLAYINEPKDRLEVRWAEAELAAAKGDYLTATQAGQEALNGYLYQGINGPGTFGKLYYGPLMFRRPAMAMEIVPQVTQILLNDKWGERGGQLANWLAMLGQTSKAKETYEEILRLIPDQAVIRDRLSSMAP